MGGNSQLFKKNRYREEHSLLTLFPGTSDHTSVIEKGFGRMLHKDLKKHFGNAFTDFAKKALHFLLPHVQFSCSQGIQIDLASILCS